MRTYITILLAALFICNIHIPTGSAEFGTATSHLLFHFTHCNIFHLLCNLICLWSIKGKLHLPQAFLIATIASFADFGETAPTQGFSAILLAIIGYKWGLWFAIKRPAKHRLEATKRIGIYIILPVIICAFIPNVNATLHLASFTLAFLTAYCAEFGAKAISSLWNRQENRQ